MATITTLAPSSHNAHPDLASAAPAAQSTRRKCCAERHLKGAKLAVYLRARRLSHKNGDEYYESTWRTADAIGYSPWTICRTSKSLAGDGWFVVLETNREAGRKGVFKPTRYRVVPHDEWALSHPGQCGPRRSKKSPAGKQLPETRTVCGSEADRVRKPNTVPCAEIPCGKTAHNVLNRSLSTNTSTSTSENISTNLTLTRARGRATVPSNQDGPHPRESRQEAASARPGEPSNPTINSTPVCSDVDEKKEKPKAANRERQGRKSPWNIDEGIAGSCALYPEDDPDMLFCWHVFGGRFQFQNGFKNDPEGDPAAFMWVVRDSYEYAKEHWDWYNDGMKSPTDSTVSAQTLQPINSPYQCARGVVKFMTLVADRLEEENVSARCFFAALHQAREELHEEVEEYRKK